MSNELGKLLEKLRAGRTYREISQLTGISHAYLSLLEKGFDPRTGKEIKPSADKLKLIATAYNYPYNELLEIAGIVEDTDRVKVERLLKANHELFEQVRNYVCFRLENEIKSVGDTHPFADLFFNLKREDNKENQIKILSSIVKNIEVTEDGITITLQDPDPELQVLWHKIKNLPPDARKALGGLIDYLASNCLH